MPVVPQCPVRRREHRGPNAGPTRQREPLLSRDLAQIRARVVLALTLAALSVAGCRDMTDLDGGVGPDAGVDVDAGTRDAGSVDAGPTDAGAADAGPTDAGGTDAGPTDAGPTDAGTTDAGPTDAGRVDAGPTDAGATDAGPTTCPVGRADCDSNPADCETLTSSDVTNCGRCGRVCGGTATCNAGLCSATLVLDPDVSSNYCGAVFTTDRLFAMTCWGNSDLSELRTTPLEPGSDVRGTSIIAYNNVSVVAMRGLFIDGPHVLFGLEGNPSRVFEVPTADAGSVSVRFTTDAGQRFDSLQVVDDTYYWIRNRHIAGGMVVPDAGSLHARGRADLQDTTLVTGLGLTGGLQVSPTRLSWVEAQTAASGWAIYDAPRAGTGGNRSLVREIAPVAAGAYLTMNGTQVYWTDKLSAPNGRIRRYDTAAATVVVETVATGLNQPEGLATDGVHLYFKQQDALYRVGVDGGVVEQLSPVVTANDSQATQIYGADARYVYFVAGPTAGDSKIYRVAK